MIDLLFFICILFVFTFAYGIASQAILNPNTTNFSELFRGVFYKSYFQIFGELFLDEIWGKLDTDLLFKYWYL